jgi:Ser/Thr protein kinase RdoA (MazF antagonist)
VSLGAWPGLVLGERLSEGHRNEVSSGSMNGERVAVRRSKRSRESLQWELDLLDELADRGFHIARPIVTSGGDRQCDGWVVQHWVDGRPPSNSDDWRLVADELRRLHAESWPMGQRPGCCSVTELRGRRRSVDADLDAVPSEVGDLVCEVFDLFADAPVSLIHGDPGRSNIRVDDHDQIWLLDWDESRVDLSLHDLSNLGIAVLDPDEHRRAQLLSLAWETVNAWTAEPEYAKARLRQLRDALAMERGRSGTV